MLCFSLSSLVFPLLPHLVSWVYDASRMDGRMLEEVRGAWKASLDGFHGDDQFQQSSDLADVKK